MNPSKASLSLRPLWIASVIVFIAVTLYPVSSRLTRASGLLLLGAIWCGFVCLCWHRRALRFFLLGFTGLVIAFLASPARPVGGRDALREDYVAGLRRYDGVRYFWGGESHTGIDCSGLIRRGLIDSLLYRGIRTADPGLVRSGLSLWWSDCTARVLGQAPAGLTERVGEAESINQLDHSTLLPGDMAVTRDGLHVMAYLGDMLWIEADPAAQRVITVEVPENNNNWFDVRVKIVRWSILAESL